MAARPRRIGLTKNGYTGVSLHKNVAGHLNGATSTQPSNELHDVNPRTPSPDISAPPISSSDEGEDSAKRKRSEALLDADEWATDTCPHKKRAIQAGGSTRHKRSVRATPSQRDSSNQAPAQENVDPREEEIFGSSQQRRGARGYGKTYSYERKPLFKTVPKDDGFKAPPNLGAEQSSDIVKEPSFIRPRGLDSPRNKGSETAEFITCRNPDLSETRGEAPTKEFRQKALKIADPLLRTEVQQAIDASAGGFITRVNPLDNVSEPSSSIETVASDVSSPVKSRRPGSSGSSSLSSVPSSPKLGNESTQLKSSPAQCPLCGTEVSRDFYESYNNGQPLRFVDQPRFCHDHRSATARSDWQRLGYPSIDWTRFTTSRITKKHMHILRQVIYGKRESHYSTVLSTHASKGPKALQTYFKEGIVDVVSAGYYGPKGSKIMARGIQERLSKQLHDSARKNDLVRDAGVGGYVQGVLVPELTVQLVKEDFNLTDDGSARKIMNESMDIGILLNGEEEDTIVQDEE